MKDLNLPKEPIVEAWLLNRYYHCPNCKAFQLPESKDLLGTVAECKYCGQKIDYKNYIIINNYR